MHTDGERTRALWALGLGPDASTADVQAAYRRLVRRYHPDRTGTAASTEQLSVVVEAHRILQSQPSAAPEPPSTPPGPSPRPPTARMDTAPIVPGLAHYTPSPPGTGV